MVHFQIFNVKKLLNLFCVSLFECRFFCSLQSVESFAYLRDVLLHPSTIHQYTKKRELSQVPFQLFSLPSVFLFVVFRVFVIRVSRLSVNSRSRYLWVIYFSWVWIVLSHFIYSFVGLKVCVNQQS